MISELRITLIISTYNHLRPLELCVSAFERQTLQPYEILIADDGSGPKTCELIQRMLATSSTSFRHIWHEDKGFRKNTILNLALAQAKGNYIILTDADCIPHPKFIEDHAQLAENGFWVQGRRSYLSEAATESMQLGERVHSAKLFFAGQLSGAFKGFRFPIPIIKKNQLQRGIIGCNMAMWKADLLAVNGWDEEYVGWGIGEDSDVGSRLYHLGRLRKFVYGRAIQYHMFHPILNRDHLAFSQSRFIETLQSKKIRCTKGVDQYL